ncbi:hypothetical protein LCGC14_2852920, partial [marine sediment metagenome]
GFGINDVESSINLAYKMRHSDSVGLEGEFHPMIYNFLKGK